MSRVTIEDLKRIRDEARHTMVSRGGQARAKITIHMGTCGIAAGAREVMSALLQAIESQKISDVLVTTSSCAGLCSREPMATVDLIGQPPVKYVDLNPEKILQVLSQHALEGQIVTEFALATGCETTG